jgi:hypothetical protein
MLVASRRNCALIRSLMRKSFIGEKSKLMAFGPRRMLAASRLIDEAPLGIDERQSSGIRAANEQTTD